MRTLHLTQDQFDVLYDAIEETIYQIEEGLEGTDMTLNDYDLYHVWQQLKKLEGKSWLVLCTLEWHFG